MSKSITEGRNHHEEGETKGWSGTRNRKDVS